MDFSTLVPTLARYGAPMLAELFETAASLAGGPVAGLAVKGVADFLLGRLAERLGTQPTADAVGAAITADPDKARTVLPQVEADHAALIASARSQAEIDEANLESARATELELARTGSLVAWGAPAVSVTAVVGFVVVSCLVFLGHGGDSVGGQQILGAMTVGWTTVLTYWLGSSKGSADKTGELAALTRAALTGTVSAARTKAAAPARAAR